MSNAAKKVRINVVSAFTLILGDQSQEKYAPGLYEVDAETAGHWYVKAHCGSVMPQEPVSVAAGEQAPAGLNTDGADGSVG